MQYVVHVRTTLIKEELGIKERLSCQGPWNPKQKRMTSLEPRYPASNMLTHLYASCLPTTEASVSERNFMKIKAISCSRKWTFLYCWRFHHERCLWVTWINQASSAPKEARQLCIWRHQSELRARQMQKSQPSQDYCKALICIVCPSYVKEPQRNNDVRAKK